MTDEELFRLWARNYDGDDIPTEVSYPGVVAAMRAAFQAGQRDVPAADPWAPKTFSAALNDALRHIPGGLKDKRYTIVRLAGEVMQLADEIEPVPYPPAQDGAAKIALDLEAQIKHMVNRFLGWRIPDDFHPDAGISFTPEYNLEYAAKRGTPPPKHEPVGTNLLDATQADAMVRYMIEGLGSDG